MTLWKMLGLPQWGSFDGEIESVKLMGFKLPSRELTYPTLGKGKSSSKVIFDGIC